MFQMLDPENIENIKDQLIHIVLFLLSGCVSPVVTYT